MSIVWMFKLRPANRKSHAWDVRGTYVDCKTSGSFADQRVIGNGHLSPSPRVRPQATASRGVLVYASALAGKPIYCTYPWQDT